jgi:hypothetical protein
MTSLDQSIGFMKVWLGEIQFNANPRTPIFQRFKVRSVIAD